MRKKILSVFMGVLLMAAMVGCGSSTDSGTASTSTSSESVSANSETDTTVTSSQPEIILKYAELNPSEHPMGQGAEKFAELVSEKSNGRIKIDLYLSGTLGDEKTSMQGVQIGTIDIFRANANNMGDYNCNLMNALALPYVFPDIESLHSVLTGEIGQDLLNEVQASGTQMVGLGYMEEGARNLFFTDKAVTTLDGLKGLKIRVPETEVMIKTMEALGANPTPISYSELYTSLQTGVVDGAENAVTGYVTNSFQEVAPYYLKDAHTFGPGLIVISEKSWSSLSSDDQEILKNAASETQEYVFNLSVELENQYYDGLEESGIEVLEVEDIENWRSAVKDVYSLYGDDVLELVTKIQEQVQQ
ncbi:MAG: TRAP transporter substrate-binding protein DctP [Lachnospiraceae bacterium]